MANTLKDELESSAADLIAWIERTGTDAEAFAREQAPLVAQEIINWSLWEHALSATACAFIVIVLVESSRRFWNHWGDGSRDDPAFVLPILFASLGIALFFICCVVEALCAVKAIVAPRLVILDYLKELL